MTNAFFDLKLNQPSLVNNFNKLRHLKRFTGLY